MTVPDGRRLPIAIAHASPAQVVLCIGSTDQRAALRATCRRRPRGMPRPPVGRLRAFHMVRQIISGPPVPVADRAIAIRQLWFLDTSGGGWNPLTMAA